MVNLPLFWYVRIEILDSQAREKNYKIIILIFMIFKSADNRKLKKMRKYKIA